MSTERRSTTQAIQHRVASLALLCAAVTLTGRASAAAGSGWYTQAQAVQGQQLFNNYCAQCHRPDLTGAVGPALVGDAFLKKWGNKPLSDLFSFEHSNMPANNPGSLPDDVMWNITAYILQKNGFQAGAIALSQPTGANKVLGPK